MDSNVLKSIYLFKGLGNDALEKLARLAVVEKRAAGENVFTQGEVGKALYIVRHGSIKIQCTGTGGEEIQVAYFGSGAHFGEMAFVDGQKRSGTASATETSELLRLDFSKLTQLFAQDAPIAAHFYKAIAQFLAGRLEMTTRDLGFARERKLKAA